MNKSFEGHDVFIKWIDPTFGLHYFKVLKVRMKHQLMLLEVLADPNTNNFHVGHEHVCSFDEIRSISLAKCLSALENATECGRINGM